MKKKSLFAVKFTVVALAVGFFSPSVNVVKNVTLSETGYNLSVSIFNTAEARGRGGRGGGARGGNARGGNRNANRNRNSNRNVNRNRNVNVNVHGGGGRYYGGGGYRGAPVAAGLVTGMVVGTAVASTNNP
jgi:hypothetical protein